MKICIVAEGCYPYVVGGVSGWINSMIKAFPNVEFIVLSIISDRSQSGRFQYDLPENISAVYEAYLNDVDFRRGKDHRKIKLTKEQYRAIRSIILNYKTDWDVVFDLFAGQDISVDDLLMGQDFFHIVEECYESQYSQIVFSDFLWTMRSICLPLFLILNTNIPKADIYHCVSTGYAGVLGAMAKHRYLCGLIVSEHGIYTREREEEILKAKWVNGVYKNIWIDQFHKMSMLAYENADVVTCLYEHASKLQIDLGCDARKIRITPNGIAIENLDGLPAKGVDENTIDVGAILRVTPIKDVKTLIRAFAFAKREVQNLRLWIMGPMDEDEEYAKECTDLVDALMLEDVFFTGRIRINDYLGKMDFTILTSISEGQPLTILESFAARKPVIATDVGNCRHLIYGEASDTCGTAGILTHIMNTDEIAQAIITLAKSKKTREDMGENGYRRVKKYYQIGKMRETYQAIYQDVYIGMDE